MQRAQSHRRAARHLRRKKGIMSSLKGVPHPSERARSRLFCKLQMWIWRKWKERCRFGQLRARKKGCRINFSPCLSMKNQLQKNKGRTPTHHAPNKENSSSELVSPLGGDAEGSEELLTETNGLLKLCASSITTSSSQNPVPDTAAPTGDSSQTLPSQITDSLLERGKMAEPSKPSHAVKPQSSPHTDTCGLNTHSGEPRTIVGCQKTETGDRSGEFSTTTLCPGPGPGPGAGPGTGPGAGPGPGQAATRDSEERISSKKAASSLSDVSFKVLTKDVHEFLDDFSRKYGSFIPLQKNDVLRHLRRKLNAGFSERKNLIFSEVTKYRAAVVQKPAPPFRVVYKKHTLTLEDLSTLADQNWLNDQVMNMYGELIMEAAHHKVHFLNSFFHRQLMTKGYDGVKRWTKQVDLFSKTFLLVPIHLEVHWCLVTADIVKKKICLYDSQGHALLKVARNILRYLMTEAKEKKQTAFENGWAVSFDEKIPQQTNENDCGVFVLEYSRCLALEKPLQFSQKDIPKIRKRIYKELCDHKLHEQ